MIGQAVVAGAEGVALSFEGTELLTLRLPRAFAPGAPFEGVVRLADGEVVIRGRAIGSKKTPEGSFEVRARLVSLRREDRERLLAASSPSGAGSSGT